MLDDGSSSNALVKVPTNALARWEEEHDAAGRSIVHGVRVQPKSEDHPSGQV